MPELPEVEATARSLRRLLPRKVVASVEVRQVTSVRTHTVGAFARLLTGKHIESVSRRGKTLLLMLSEGWTLLVHFKLWGIVRFWRAVPWRRAVVEGVHQIVLSHLTGRPRQHSRFAHRSIAHRRHWEPLGTRNPSRRSDSSRPPGFRLDACRSRSALPDHPPGAATRHCGWRRARVCGSQRTKGTVASSRVRSWGATLSSARRHDSCGAAGRPAVLLLSNMSTVKRVGGGRMKLLH